MQKRAFSCVIGLAILFATALFAVNMTAQATSVLPQAVAPTQTTTPAQEAANDDPLGRSTPRGTVMGFIRAVNRSDYDQASRYLDTKQHGEEARDLAQQLETVLDRATSIDLNKLSRKPEGNESGLVRPGRYLVGTLDTSNGKLEILLDRVEHEDQPPIWLFSETTLERIPDVYEETGESSQVESRLPGWLKATVFNVPVWRLLVFLVAIAVVLLAGAFLVRLLQSLLVLIEKRVWGESSVARSRGLAASLRLVLFGIFAIIYGNVFSDTLLHRTFWRSLGIVLIVFGIAWLLIRVFGLLTEVAVARLKHNESFDKIAMAGLVGRLLQILIFTVGLMLVLHLVGINLTAALTGLGIGGLAVAFAAQKTLENLFGGIMIISDRPVRVGDLCKVGDILGNVVDIGLRSTQIRAMDRSIVTIPNGQLAAANIENLTLRDKYWFHHTLSVSQQTTQAQMMAVLEKIRRMLDEHDRVESKTIRVRFSGIGSSSFDLLVFAYLYVQDLDGFYELQEELLLAILAILESAGATLAVPAQITHVVNAGNEGTGEQGTGKAGNKD